MARLDQYVTEKLGTVSPPFAAKLIEQGRIIVIGQPQLKPGYRLRDADM